MRNHLIPGLLVSGKGEWPPEPRAFPRATEFFPRRTNNLRAGRSAFARFLSTAPAPLPAILNPVSSPPLLHAHRNPAAARQQETRVTLQGGHGLSLPVHPAVSHPVLSGECFFRRNPRLNQKHGAAAWHLLCIDHHLDFRATFQHRMGESIPSTKELDGQAKPRSSPIFPIIALDK